MQYNDLLYELTVNSDFKICNNTYSLEHFGSFNIDFLYKRKISMQFLNDRDIIEIFLIHKSLLSSRAVPLEFAVDYLNGCASEIKKYTFQSISDAYKFLSDSTPCLEEITEKDLLKKILKAFDS